jgi:predicted nucleotidyltransferase
MFVLNVDKIRARMAELNIPSIEHLARRIHVHRNSLGRYFCGAPVLPGSISRMLEDLSLDSAAALRSTRERTEVDSEPIAPLIDRLTEKLPKAAYALFGSRASHRARKYSDFDIGVFSIEELSLETYLALIDEKEAFEESSPYFVDLVNLNRADAEFLRNIKADMRFLGGRHSDWVGLLKRISAA